MKQTGKENPPPVASSSEDEDSDSCTQQSSSDTAKEVNVPQFSVLRSDSDGLRMKISAIRNLHETSDKQKMGSSNNNNVKSNKNNADAAYNSRKRKKRKISSGTSSSCCSICSRSETEYSSEAVAHEKTRKTRVKRKRASLGLSDKKKLGNASTDSEFDKDDKQKQNSINNLVKSDQNLIKRGSSLQCDVLPGSCISSSDNELPALVNAAIKCVESCSEGENQTPQPSKQYTSALLRDFMVKTQMLGNSSTSISNKNISDDECNSKTVPVDSPLPNSSSSTTQARKKRGRPKKNSNAQNISKGIILESADSGITSTAQSLSPSPNSHNIKKTNKIISDDVKKCSGSQNTTPLQKISLVSLDKQMYATERILYPPKGKKRITSKPNVKMKSIKEDVLDPLWKKIDVNTKFRRPSLTGYKSDCGTTICSKILAARSGYISDYGSVGYKAFSGYKSDASGKSRYSMRSYVSRAKSCDYRCGFPRGKTRKFRRKRSTDIKSAKSFGNVNEQDILQLAGLSLGQSSEESSRESICKPILSNSQSKKYGEINRFVRTGEYFGRSRKFESFNSAAAEQADQNCDTNSILGTTKFSSLSQNGSATFDFPKKIRLRRSSAVSRCSSFTTVSRCDLKKRRRRRPRFKNTRNSHTDSKFNTEIEILINTFATLRLFNLEKSSTGKGRDGVEKDKSSNVKGQTKRNLKKRKFSDNSEHHPTSAILKRRHKRTSPDEHKLPLKKRHYLLTPGEKSEGKNLQSSDAKGKDASGDNKSSTGKNSVNVLTKITSKAVTPKKRHLLETTQSTGEENLNSKSGTSNSTSETRQSTKSGDVRGGGASPRIPNAPKGDKEIVKKKNRLEGLVSRIQTVSGSPKEGVTPSVASMPGYPPPGVFEPSIELEIQIPLTNLAASAIITKAEIDSPKVGDFTDVNKPLTEPKCEKVVETLLNKTGANFLMRRKRRKTNRTGFPSVKKKKRKTTIDEPALSEEVKYKTESESKAKGEGKTELKDTEKACDRVPRVGEASDSFLERYRQPRLTVVSLEKLQEPVKKLDDVDTSEMDAIDIGTNLKTNALSSNPVVALTPCDLKVNNSNGQKMLLRRRPITRRRRGRRPWYTRAIKLPKKKENIDDEIVSLNIKESVDDAEAKPNKIAEELDQQQNSPSNNNEKIESNKTVSTAVESMGDNSSKSNRACKKETPIECSSFEDLEQEPLPANEGPTDSDDVQSNDDRNGKNRKVTRWKKTYLTAGLLSDFYKIDSKTRKSIGDRTNKQTELTENKQTSVLLPPPPYCEKHFRKTVSDFLLPYDIWWAYKNAKLPTRVTVPSWNYKRIRTNVYGDVRPNPVTDHQACNCKAETACGDDCLNRMVYTECSPSNCPCRDKCQNQKIQKHDIAPGIQRFMTENKGWGVRTSLPIKKGMYILEYVGEVVTEKEFKERMATLYVNDTHHYCLNLDGGLVIDGHRMGSDGRFVNHSCSPNCEIQKWSVNGLFRMALFASRDISSGEELTYDYNFSLFNPSEGQPCRCETPHCRGVIGGKSQRVKPLEQKFTEAITQNATNKSGRTRKRQARKITGRFQSKDVVVSLFQQPTDREKRIARATRCFLIRNLEKVRKLKMKLLRKDTSTPSRPLTPVTLAAQISALRVPRNIKTRGLTQAAHDPEVEKIAKMAVILRDICIALENVKDKEDKSQLAKLLPAFKKRRLGHDKTSKIIDFSTVQTNIERGFYKEPSVFDEDINKVFTNALAYFGEHSQEAGIVIELSNVYKEKKFEAYEKFLEIVPNKELSNFRPAKAKRATVNCKKTEDIIQCICGLFKDEGLMIQCSKCLVWQHAECTKANVSAEKYLCERCESRTVDLEIPLDEYTEEGYRYYLSLLRGELQVRQSDTVYVLRDIPIKDENGKVFGTKKHTYETIGKIDYSECDIFRVERLWKDNDGKRYIFGHHYLRPHETFHEPTRKFYENEVVRVPLYEVVPIELVIGRCWVLDRNTFCKGRPVDVSSEKHVYICELRVDKSARFFAKAKQSYPTCTKNYAFKKYPEALKISRTYSPHEVDPALVKPKKRKHEDVPATQTKKSTTPVLQLLPPPAKTVSERRARLESILANLRKRQSSSNLVTLDLSYLLTGRGARQRRANAVNVPI